MRRSTLNKIAIPVLVAILILIATNAINSADDEYADVGYTLLANDWISRDGNLKVELKLKNDGNIDCTPISKFFVENATIQKVEINGVQQVNLWKYCNSTDDAKSITIDSLIAQAEMKFSTWATVTVVPDEGVSGFSVHSLVTIPDDLMHPNNKAVGTVPRELFYIESIQGEYVLAD